MAISTVKALKASVAGVALLASVSAAQANVYTTGNHAYWTAFGGTTADGNRECGVDTGFRSMDGSADGSFDLKTFHNGTYELLMFKRGWQIPLGQPVTIDLQVDSAPVLRLYAIGVQSIGFSGFDAVISVNDRSPISTNMLPTDLLNLLAHGVSMHVNFPAGNEPPWTASLSGFTAALGDMARCAQAYGWLGAPQSTQPYTATQPFAYRPQTQPF